MRRLSTVLPMVALLMTTAMPAVAQSPTEELLSGMVTEEVEPGVFRVINDGVRDLSIPSGPHPGAFVDLTPDGDVWVWSPGVMYHLGAEGWHRAPSLMPPYLEPGPDGTLWGIGETGGVGETIRSFDGARWTERSRPTDTGLAFDSLDIGPDGTVWVAASGPDDDCSDEASPDCRGTVLLRLEDDSSLTVIEGWGDLYAGDVASDEVTVSPDGDVLLLGMGRSGGSEAEALRRFDGSGWDVVPGPLGFANQPLGRSIGFAPDGTLWAQIEHPDGRPGGLVRFDDPGWTTFSEADGVQDRGWHGYVAVDLLTVAPDGSVWMNGTPGGGGGVAHYDGTTWTSYLHPYPVHDIAIAPDGTAFVRANLDTGDCDVGLYVITPEAVAASE